jgi:hypothetical protein
MRVSIFDYYKPESENEPNPNSLFESSTEPNRTEKVRFVSLSGLHRLLSNGMKFSELIGLWPVSIQVDSKKFENFAKGSHRGVNVGFHS